MASVDNMLFQRFDHHSSRKIATFYSPQTFSLLNYSVVQIIRACSSIKKRFLAPWTPKSSLAAARSACGALGSLVDFLLSALFSLNGVIKLDFAINLNINPFLLPLQPLWVDTTAIKSGQLCFCSCSTLQKLLASCFQYAHWLSNQRVWLCWRHLGVAFSKPDWLKINK